MRNFIIFLFTFVFLPVWASAEAGTDNGEPSITADSAIRVALDWLGLDQNDSLSSFKIGSDPALMRMTYDEPEPVVKEDLEGRLVWRVTLDSVILTIEHARPPRNETSPHNARVYIDAHEATLLKAVYSDRGIADSKHNPCDRMRKTTNFSGFSHTRIASTKPDASFLAALRRRYELNATQKRFRMPDGSGTGGSHPLNSKQVELYPVVFDWPSPDQRPFKIPKDSVPVWLMVPKNWDTSIGGYRGEESLRRWQPSLEYRVLDPTTDSSRLRIEHTYTDEPVPQKPRRKAE